MIDDPEGTPAVDRDDAFRTVRHQVSNGAAFEIHDPQMIALHPRTAHVANQDQSWIIIQYVTICSVESIFPDYQGTLGEYESRRDK